MCRDVKYIILSYSSMKKNHNTNINASLSLTTGDRLR